MGGKARLAALSASTLASHGSLTDDTLSSHHVYAWAERTEDIGPVAGWRFRPPLRQTDAARAYDGGLAAMTGRAGLAIVAPHLEPGEGVTSDSMAIRGGEEGRLIVTDRALMFATDRDGVVMRFKFSEIAEAEAGPGPHRNTAHLWMTMTDERSVGLVVHKKAAKRTVEAVMAGRRTLSN